MSAFLNQYRDPMQIVLLGAAIISLWINEWSTALLLIVLTLFNAFLALRQEGKAEASVAALQKLLIVKSKVRRGGELLELPAEQIVPGDIVLLEAGDRVPADGRIIKAATLEIAESALTGESAPVPKEVTPVAKVETPLGDRVDMAYMQTEVTRGAGEILVTATGMETEVGHISDLLQTTKIEETPLTKQLNKLTNQIVIIALVALFLYLLIGYFRNGQKVNSLLLAGVAFAIASIPTALPAVVTYLLASGTTALASVGAIVKRLRSVETLGATSAINSDKTGTLTLNQMTAVEMAVMGQRYTFLGVATAPTGRSRMSLACPPRISSPTCCRWRSHPTRWRKMARWSAIRRKALWSCWRPKGASTRRQRESSIPAWRRSRSTRPTSSWRPSIV